MGKFRRRQFLIASGAMLASRLARAQPRAPDGNRTIGVLFLNALDPKSPPTEDIGTKTLRKLGWIEGQNIVIERRFADFRRERLAGLAQELVRKRVEVIFAIGPQPAIEAGRATQTIPIVFFNGVWPVETGLVDSLARPGRNLTGTSLFADTGVSTKRLEFLREIVPAAKRLSQLSQPDIEETLAGGRFDMRAVFQAAAERLGFERRVHVIRKVEDFDAAFAEIIAWGAHAINGAGGDYIFAARERIAEFALRHRLPSVFSFQAPVEAGGLLSYSPATAEWTAMVVRSAEYIDRILRGARPAELPVVLPNKYELLINLKTAKALGLKIPPPLLLRADRVIE
jgi:putative ABC transport system substrate-binding protein